MKAIRFSADDLAIVTAAQQKLGLRTASEVLRMGLRSLAREQDLVVATPAPKPNELDDLG